MFIVDDYYGCMPKDFGCKGMYHFIRESIEVLALDVNFGWYKDKGVSLIPGMDGADQLYSNLND